MEGKEKENKLEFPVIGIGASAGGLREFEQFFEKLPDQVKMAFIIIQHLDPDYESNLVKIVEKYTLLKVNEAKNHTKIKKNNVYIIPPNQKLSVKNRIINIKEFEEPRGKRFPIDYLFRSLADDLKEKSIGIILSGTGTDGTSGLRKIKGVGGMAMVQDPETTEYSGMPNSAIKNVPVDYILPTGKMPEILIDYIETYYGKLDKIKDVSTQNIEKSLSTIYKTIRSEVGYEFSVYKNSTILRRVERRMTINQINSIERYVEFLKNNTKEIKKLYHEMLIGVTSFFRDKEAFDALEKKVIKPLIKSREEGSDIRIWIPGCSTGEEAYSIAILLHKNLDTLNKQMNIQVFGTDIDEHAIEIARKGIYKHNIIIDVPQDILDLYFHEENSDFRVSKKIRNSIVFAMQNVLRDPPFSNIDLISCRNLLIYIQNDVQKKLLKLFQYSLKNNGYLFLGNSESIGNASDLFDTIDRKNKIFHPTDIKISYKGKLGSNFPPLYNISKKKTDSKSPMKESISKNYRSILQKLMFEHFIPPALLVNSNYQVLYIHGKTSKYLEYHPGEPSLNLKDMIRTEIRTEVIASLRKVLDKKEKIEFRNIHFKFDSQDVRFNLLIQPIDADTRDEDLFVIIFDEIPKETKIQSSKEILDEQEGDIQDFNQLRVQQLEAELKSTKRQLKATIEELETTNQELKSTNEEYLSANEELKSTNEELQTSKEELQSVNEELVTVNTELQSKIEELSNTNDDLRNLISSTEIGTLFLDKTLSIRRFTEPVKELFRLRESDEGRSLEDISSTIKNNQIIEDARKVLNNLIPIDRDIQAENKEWYHTKIIPYRTEENLIDGVVITFMDITSRKQMEQSLKKSEAKFRDAYNQMKFYEDLFSHDMRNILQVILSSMESAISKITDDPVNSNNISDLLHLTEEQVSRGFKLIKNVQKLSEFERSANSSQPAELTTHIKKSRQNVKNMFNNQKIEFYIDFFQNKVLVEGSHLLEDVFENLFMNSIKYNENTTKKIWVGVTKIIRNKKNYIRVEIEDNGIGIKDNLKNKLFKEKITNSYSKGMGIGLTIVKKIIDLFHGDIWVEDRVENQKIVGSRFVILLHAA